MKTAVRIVVIILCIIALWYLVVLLARGVANETGSTPTPTGNVLADAATRPLLS